MISNQVLIVVILSVLIGIIWGLLFEFTYSFLVIIFSMIIISSIWFGISNIKERRLKNKLNLGEEKTEEVA